MQVRAEVVLSSAIKSLTDVVLPAIDADNAPAAEQLRLVLGLLEFLHKRLPLQYRYDCDELERALALGDALRAILAEHAGALDTSTLDAARAKAQGELARAQTGPNRVQAAARALRAATSAVVAQRYRDGSEDERGAIARAVLDYSTDQLLRDRAWVSVQGWEVEELPSVESLLFD